MNTKPNVSRFADQANITIQPSTRAKANEEGDSYEFSRISPGHYACTHGKNTYIIIDKDGKIGCSCDDMTYRCTDTTMCKHCTKFIDLEVPPQIPAPGELIKKLILMGWVGGKDDLHPAEMLKHTPDTPAEPKPYEEPDPVLDQVIPEMPEPPNEDCSNCTTETVHYECPNCGDVVDVEGGQLAAWILNHMDTCTGKKAIEPPEKQNMAEEQTKTYAHPDGTEFPTAEALLDYADKLRTSNVPPPATRRVRHKAMIKGISPRLQEIGRVAVGEKGGLSRSGKTRLPTKLDHFIFTTLDKDEDDRYIRDQSMMDMFGENCTEIPIRLLYNDIELNFPTFYAKYARSGIKLRGDGENWTVYTDDGTREEIYDPNNERGFLDDVDVKPHGILTVLVEGQNSVGGVFKFRTTSWNSINNILSSLSVIKNMCGMLTYIPLKLVYRKKEVTPIGMAHKTWIPVVSVEFRGSIEELQAQAEEVRNYMTAGQKAEMQQIDAAVRDHLDEDETLEVQQDMAAEFAPGVE